MNINSRKVLLNLTDPLFDFANSLVSQQQVETATTIEEHFMSLTFVISSNESSIDDQYVQRVLCMRYGDSYLSIAGITKSESILNHHLSEPSSQHRISDKKNRTFVLESNIL